MGRNRDNREIKVMSDISPNGVIMKSTGGPPTKRIMISVPTTGLIRIEWSMSRYGQVIPCNWSQAEFFQWLDQFSPLGFGVADARNVAVASFIQEGFEWLFFIDHDTLIPRGTFLWLNEMMQKADVPIFGGIYFTKSMPSEPLIYRGRGTGFFPDWKWGDQVWCDGMGMGCHMIHRSIIQTVWDNSPEYTVGSAKVRRVFESPATTWYDPEQQAWMNASGTEDLKFYWRLIDEGLLEKAGWPKYQEMKYPYLCNTNIFCKHIDNAGIQYPACGEEHNFDKDS
jgi:hypothetical protein